MFRIRQARRRLLRRYEVVLTPPDADRPWRPAHTVGRLRLRWRLHREGFDPDDVVTILDHARGARGTWLHIHAGRTPRTGPREERRVQPSEYARLRGATVVLREQDGQLAGDLLVRAATPQGEEETFSLGPRGVGPIDDFAGKDLWDLEYHFLTWFREHVHDLREHRYLLAEPDDLDALHVDYDIAPEVAAVLDDTTPRVRPWADEPLPPRTGDRPLSITWVDE